MDSLRKSSKPLECGFFYSQFPRTDKMNFIKTVVFMYDTITLPIYYIAQRPWRKNSKKTKTKLVEEGDHGVSLVRIGSQPGCHLDDYCTIDQAMMAVCSKFGSKPCFGVRETLVEEEFTNSEGKVLKKKILAPSYEWVTYSQIDKTIDDFMRGMLTYGVTPGSNVVIFAETRMEWMIAFHGLLRINCAIVTLYANLGKEGIVHVLNQVEAEYVVISSDVLVKLKQLRSDLKFVKKLVVLESKANPVDLTSGLDGYQVISYRQLINQGSQANPGLKNKPCQPDDVALIMYTSGSTGVPKGVQISHRNFMSAVRSMNTIVAQYTKSGGTYIAYLPLAHIYECVVENCMMMMGHAVGYSSPFTLTNNSPAIKEGVQGDLPTLKPRVLCGVPLVLDRIRKEVTKTVESKGGLAAKLFYFGLDYKNYWMEKGYETPIMDRLIFKRTIEALGGDCKIIISGGAPLSLETQYFARACFSVDLIVGYSATECCCAGTCMDLGDTSLGNVGYPLYGVRIRLVPWEEGGYRPDDKPNPRGEIVIGGDSIAQGYYKNEEETQAAFKEENGIRWFYTGDIGEILPHGGIKIIDRRKDLVKLQFGEYVSLGKVEAALVGNPLIDFICIYGDSLHNYVVALIVPNPHSLKNLAKKIHPDLESWLIRDLCDNPKVVDQVLKEIEAFSLKIGLIKYEIPRRIKLCKEEWTPDSGLVTAAMKIRRNELKKFYNEDIKRMYTDDNVDQNQNMRKI